MSAEPVACKHSRVQTWRFADDGEVAPLWSCVDCNRRFEPIDPERDRATLEAAVATAVAQERWRWQQAAETMAQEADQKFPMDGTVAHWLRSLLAKRAAIRNLKPEDK